MPTFRAGWMRKGRQQSRLRRNSTRGRRKTKRVQGSGKERRVFQGKCLYDLATQSVGLRPVTLASPESLKKHRI